jgi:DNA-binding NarL/FixJ family response regulator
MSAVAPTALIVDRWALVRLGIAAVLRPAGIRVVAGAEHGRDGLAALRDQRPGLVIVGLVDDVTLADFVREAKALDPAPSVICLVTQLDRDELTDLLGLGTDGILVRAAAGDDLGEAVTKVLAGERSLAPAVLALAAQGPDEGGLAAGESGTVGTGTGELTAKEREVLTMLASGSANKAIADALFVSQATVKTHLSHIYSKLGVSDRHEAIARAVELGLLT